MDKQLNPGSLQERFCHEYILDRNATQAAIRAGYSPKTAASSGYRLLRHPAVKQFLEKLEQQLSEQYKVSRERLIRELAIIAFADIADYYHENNGIKQLHEIDPDKRRALSALQVRTCTTKVSASYHLNLKMHDKQGAIMKLGRHLGFFDKEQDENSGLRKLIFVTSGVIGKDEPVIFEGNNGEEVDQEEIGRRWRTHHENSEGS